MKLSVPEAGDPVSVEQLVQAAQGGSNEALATLIARCHDMVLSQAAKFCTCRLTKEDLAQEGFLALLSAVDTFDAERHVRFEAFAAVCVRNRMISAGRKAPARLEVSLAEWEEAGQADVSPQSDPAAVLVERDEEERLLVHLKKVLTPLEYQVLVLRLASCSYEKIAARIGVSAKSVDNAMQRVRRKLSVGRSSSTILHQ